MSESKGMSGTNRAMLVAAFLLLAAAVGYAMWRDSAPAPDAPAAASGDPLAAIEARTQASPKSAEAWSALGAARFDLGDFAGAAAAYEKASALAPEPAELWSARGAARGLASARRSEGGRGGEGGEGTIRPRRSPS